MMSFLLTNKGAHTYNGNMMQCLKCKKWFKSDKTLMNHNCPHCVTCRHTYSTYQRFSTHMCRPAGRNVQHSISNTFPGTSTSCSIHKKTEFSAEKLVKLIKGNELTNDDTICYISEILKSTFPHVLVAVLSPALVEVLLRYTVKPQPCVPLHEHSVNIHYTTEHWVTSWQDPCTRTVHVFDSLTSETRLKNIMPTLQLFYHVDELRIVYEKCLSQQTLPNCGLYATTYAYYCCKHINPKGLVLPEGQLCQNIFTLLFPVSHKRVLDAKNGHTSNTVSQDSKRKKLSRSDMTQEELDYQRLKDRERKQKATESKTEEEKERDRQKNKESQKMSRNRKTADQAQADRQKNQESHKLSRSKRTADQISADRQKNQESHKLSRGKRTTDQISADRQKNQQSHKVSRSKRTADQISADRQKDQESHKVSRSKRTADQISADRQKDQQSHKVSRSKRSSDQISADRQKNQESHKVSRSKRTADQISADRQKDQESHKVSRSKRTADQISADRQKDQESHKVSRSKRTADQISADRQKDQESHKVLRSKRTADQISADRQKNQESHKDSRSKRTADQISADKQKDQESHKVSRSKRNADQISADRQKNQESHKVSRSKRTADQISADRQKNQESHKVSRSKRTADQISADRQKDQESHKVSRSKRTADQISADRQKDQESRKLSRNRMTSEEVSINRRKNNESHKHHRRSQSQEQRLREQSNDRTRKSDSRNPSDIQQAISKFKTNIILAAEFICSVCHRSLFRNSVKPFKPESDTARDTDTNKLSPDGHKYICVTCHRYIYFKRKIPPQAQINKMSIPEIPEVLNLTPFETRLLARRYPFMKIVQLPKGKQKGIIGKVVNIPVDANEVCNSLPRTLASSGILPVKLKRKRSFKGHVTYQNIRPDKVKEAFKWLLKNNRHYQNVVENFHWDDTSHNDYSEVWQNFVEKEPESRQKTEIDELDADDSQADCSDSTDSDTSDDELALPTESETTEATQFDTFITSSDPAADASNIVSIAPGEGKHPIHFMLDQGCEEQSFPSLFPTGCYGFDADREIKISPKKYFNARILNYRGTFGKNLEYLFFAQYVSEHKQVMDSVSIAVRKSFRALPSSNPIDAAFIKDPEKVKSLILKDRAYQFLQTVRGSPPYWQKCMYKLMAAVKQFGIFTFFLTLSAADSKWPDSINALLRPQGKQLSEDDIQNLSWEEKSTLLKSDPVTLARHFDHRLQCFFQNILLSPSQPLGKIIHYSYRIEFQQRGSPHAHCVLWVEDAPTLNDSIKNITSFIDKYITCAIPTEEEEPELFNLVTTLQKHQHTATCRKKGTDCRFGFPKLPSFYTLIASEPESEDSIYKAATVETAADFLTTVFQTLNDDKDDEITSLEGLLLKAGISERQYMYALSIAKRGKKVILRRKIEEQFINPYNKHLLMAWQANLDVQFCLDPYACIAYMVSYITKDEREMSTVLKNVSKEMKCHGWREQLKACANAFLNARELSAQEAVYRLLSFPLFNSNFTTVFVPAVFPEKRVAFLKPQNFILSMEDEDENVFATSIIERYAARPNKLEEMCLAHFAMNYTPCKPNTKNDQHKGTKTTIQLKHDLGTMKKNAKQSVLRYHHYSVLKEPEEYYYSQLLLFLPWTSESELIQLQSYADHYERNKSIIQENQSEIEHHTDIIEEAVARLEEFGPPVHSFDNIAPSTIQDNDDDHTVVEDEEFALLNPIDSVSNVQIPTDFPVTHLNSGTALEIRPGYWPESQYRSHIRHLNEEQRNTFQVVFNWCQQKMLSSKTSVQPDQLLLFVSGGAGTGKSHLISAIYQMALRTLQVEGENPDDIHVLLTAPTGTAAHNISGTTLHSAFLLPLGQTKSYIKLSDDKRNTLRAKVGNLDLLIIDEISMVGSNLLLQLHYRLAEIKCSTNLFGGVAVIVLGDLYQLPPVKQQFVFKPVSDHIARLHGSLWDCFTFTELTKIMRQKEDLQFAQLLNRIRLGVHTEDDVQLLHSRESEDTNLGNTLHVYARNCDVDSHNQKQLTNLNQPVEHFIAIDRKPESLKDFKIQQDSKFTGGLPYELLLALGARVMLIRNIDITDGLVNGTQGQIVTFIKSGKLGTVAIGVKFDNPKVGQEARRKSPYVLELQSNQNATPILRTETTFTVTRKNKNLTVNRYQFPLKLAWACTIHKVQGLTVDQIYVSFEGRFGPGQAYVALSRARSLAGLHITSFDKKKVSTNSAVQREMERLRKDKSIPAYHNFLSMWKETIVVSVLNIRSFPCHKIDLIADPVEQLSDVCVLTETWLNGHNDDFHEFDTDFHIYRSDKQSENDGRGGGVAILARQSAFSQCSLISTYSDVQLQTVTCKLVLPPNRILFVIAVYNSPATIHAHLQSVLTAQIRHVNEVGCSPPILITGDFNQNVNGKSPAHICESLSSEGFRQHVNAATHSSGSCLDHFYLNKLTMSSQRVTPAYYSDHMWVSGPIRFQ